MPFFTQFELGIIRADVANSFFDECILYGEEVEVGKDEYGMPILSGPAEIVSPCGFAPSQVRYVMGKAEVPIYDATLRLPKSVDMRGIVRAAISKRQGEELNPKPLYEIMGTNVPGFVAWVINLRAAVL